MRNSWLSHIWRCFSSLASPVYLMADCAEKKFTFVTNVTFLASHRQYPCQYIFQPVKLKRECTFKMVDVNNLVRILYKIPIWMYCRLAAQGPRFVSTKELGISVHKTQVQTLTLYTSMHTHTHTNNYEYTQPWTLYT